MTTADLETLLRAARASGEALVYVPDTGETELVPEPAEGAPLLPYPCEDDDGR